MVPADSTSASASHPGSMHSERYFRGEFAAQIQNLFDARGRETQWSDLTPNARRDFISWIESAKLRDERKRRIEKACVMLAAGKTLTSTAKMLGIAAEKHK
jgi:hypothetical protein